MDRIKVRIENFTFINKGSWSYRGRGIYPGQLQYMKVIYNDRYFNKKAGICLLLITNEDTGEEFITFDGSIRKWYFGGNTRQDLTYVQFVECIVMLSTEIGIRKIDLWNARVINLETGVNVLLSKGFEGLEGCLVRYRNLKRNTIKSSVYFQAANFKIRIYNKWGEIFKTKKMNIYQSRFNDNFYLIRLEVDVKKITGFYKSNANTLSDIRDNWNEIIIKLNWYIKGIDFVDRISPCRNEIDLKTPQDFYDCRIHSSIRENFFDEFEKFEKLVFSKNSKSGYIKEFFSTFERNVSKITDFKTEFYLALDKKTSRLSNNSNL